MSQRMVPFPSTAMCGEYPSVIPNHRQPGRAAPPYGHGRLRRMGLHWPRRRQRFHEELEHPWYHDFSALGVPTRQAEGIFGPNQQAKQATLFSYIDKAIALVRPGARRPRAVLRRRLLQPLRAAARRRHMTGVDLGDEQFRGGDPIQLRQADAMTALLGHDGRAEFRNQNVFDVSGSFDFAICAGGLYHVTDPEALLRKLTGNVRTALVVQTVYSLAETSADYFETPAPGQTWGCRFSYGYLLAMLAEAGWTVLESTTNELGGNARPQDRGSAYALCVPRPTPAPRRPWLLRPGERRQDQPPRSTMPLVSWFGRDSTSKRRQKRHRS